MNKQMKKLYNTIYVDGHSHKMATLLWDKESKIIRYCIGSFQSRQLLDQCLSKFQMGISVRSDGAALITDRKSYVAKVARAVDENKCDGVHAVFYNNDSRIIRVYEGENVLDKVYNWLILNTQSGLIPQWKNYLFNELSTQELIHECEGYDLTGKAPRIFVMSKDINTELIRNIKGYGLKQGYINLPVENNKNIPTDMSFLEIIQDLIIPYIGEQDCQYNIGEEISTILKTPIVSGDKRYTLYPRQQILGQGLLNAIKNNVDYLIFCGGTGIGKTYTSIKLSWAVMEEVFKCNGKGKILLLSQGHLTKKWQRQMDECLNPIGVYPNYITINSFKDVNKVPKVSKGLDIIIMPKDKVKRTWLVEHSVYSKYSSKNNAVYNANKLIESIGDSKEEVIISSVSDITSMKYIAIKLEKYYSKKVVLYTPCHKNDGEIDGYYVATTSKTLKSLMGTESKSYDFKYNGDIDSLKFLVTENLESILAEEIAQKRRRIDNPVVCPHCGGTVYEKSDDLFDEERKDLFYVSKSSNIKESIKKCNSYIKADGTPLTSQEIEYIRSGAAKFKVVEEAYKCAYVDDDGIPFNSEEVAKLKKKPNGVTILVKVCGHKLFGAKNQKGYRCIDSTKYLLKKLGKRSIHISIVDECHVFSAASNQGSSFANVCRLSKVTLPLTGTLTGGKSSDLFKLLFRLSPKKMIENGYGYSDESLFIEHFGRRKQETTMYNADGKYNKSGTKVTKPWKEIPGISPMLFNLFLSNFMAARKIEDMNIPLPTIKYFKHDIEMSEELGKNYNHLKDQFLSFLQKHKGASIGGSYINGLISYPDMPQQNDIYANINGCSELVAAPNWMILKDRLLPKERKLIDTIKKELAEGRRTLVYATYTGEKGVSDRLIEILSSHFKVAELKGSKVKVENREEWIEKQYQNGYEIIVTNPECVSTGLDIVQYPTIYFYEIPLNTKTMRQAEKRAYRPSQTKECRIYYSFYKNSIQEDIILLQSQKKRASLSLEGVFSNDMLSIMSSGGDSVEAMLNKILQGKIKLKESELDDFGFEEEEVNFTFEDTDEGNVEITKTYIGTQKVIVTPEEAQNLTLFTIDEEFRKKLKKKKSVPVEGQIGFAF